MCPQALWPGVPKLKKHITKLVRKPKTSVQHGYNTYQKNLVVKFQNESELEHLKTTKVGCLGVSGYNSKSNLN